MGYAQHGVRSHSISARVFRPARRHVAHVAVPHKSSHNKRSTIIKLTDGSQAPQVCLTQ